MPETKNTCTEYEVRYLDQHGDALDVDHYETAAKAVEAGAKLMRNLPAGAVAVVVEKHTSYFYERRGEQDRYVVLYVAGDPKALAAWGYTGGAKALPY